MADLITQLSDAIERFENVDKRRNNPGGIFDVQRNELRAYPNYEEGRRALENVVRSKVGKGYNLQQFFAEYAPKGHGANDPDHYAKTVGTWLGIETNKALKELSTKQPANGSKPQTQQLNWFEYAKSLPENVPDAVYDAQRERFFETSVLPWAMREGHSESLVREKFMEQTRRPGRSAFPKTAVVVAKAAEALVDPLLNVKDPAAAKAFREQVGKVVTEAERQGEGTTLASIAGETLGMAPYFAAVPAGGGLLQMTAIAAATQGAYDAARAEEGERDIAAVRGAIIGGAVTAAGGAILDRFWRRAASSGISKEAAQAVEAVAQGSDDLKNVVTAAKAVQEDPTLLTKLTQSVKEAATESRKSGIPKQHAEVEPGTALRIRLRGADNKPYTIGDPTKPMSDAQLSQAVERIAEHLAQGGEILNSVGDPKVVNQFMRRVEEAVQSRGQLTPPVVLRGMDPQDPAVLVVPEGGSLGAGPTPTAAPKVDATLQTRVSPATASSTVQATANPKSVREQALESVVAQLNAGTNETNIVNMLQRKYGFRLEAEAKGIITEAKTSELFKPPQAKPRGRPKKEDVVANPPAKNQSVKPEDALQIARDLVTLHVPNGEADEIAAMTKLVQNVFDKRTAQPVKRQALTALRDVQPELFDSVADMIRTRGEQTRTPKKIKISDKGIEDRFQVRPDGKVLDIMDEKLYPDVQAALRGAGLFKEAKGSFRLPDGYWISPQGEVEDLGRAMHKLGVQELVEEDLKNGWVRVRGNSVETSSGFKSPGFMAGMERATFEAQKAGQNFVWVSYPQGGGRVYLNEVEDFWESPLRYLRRQQMKMAAKDPVSNTSSKAWISSEGETHLIFKGDHLDNAPGGNMQVAMQKGWVRVYADSIAVSTNEALNSKGFLAAIDFVKQKNKEGDFIYLHTPKGEVGIPYSMLDELAANPLKTIARAFGKSAIRKGSEFPGVPDSSMGFKQRPLADRLVTMYDQPGIPEGTAAVTRAVPGQKPVIYYNPSGLSQRGVIYHENMHGHLAYLNIVDSVTERINAHPMGRILPNAFEKGTIYSKHQAEEVWTYLSEGIRYKNTQRGTDLLDAFVRADEDLPSVLSFADEIGSHIQDELSRLPDSLHRRVLQRKVDDLRTRTGTMQEVEKSLNALGDRVDFEDGKWFLSDGSRRIAFNSRDDLADHIRENYQSALNEPEIIPLDELPEEILKLAQRSPSMNLGKAPIHTDPPLSAMPPKSGRVRAGASVFSFYFRPWDSWIEGVARGANWPELFDAARRLSIGRKDWDNYVHGQMQPRMLNIFGPLAGNEGKRRDVYNYLASSLNSRATAAQQLNLTEAEVAIAKRLESLADEVATDLGFSIKDWYAYSRKLKSVGYLAQYMQPTTELKEPAIKFFNKVVARGDLDPRDDDALRVLDAFINLGAREKFVGSAISDMVKLNNLKTAQGEFVMGQLQPLVKRHLDYMQGRADRSQEMISSFMGATLESMNNTIRKVNTKLPDKLRLGEFDEKHPQEALGKFMLLSYAGGLGLRVMPLIRDMMQIFTTTYPLLGAKYLMRGISKAFGAKADPTLWTIAKQYGAILEHNPLLNLYSGGYEKIQSDKLTRLAEKMLTPMQWTNNVNRLASFWGHAEKAEDALKAWVSHGDRSRLLRESGATWLDPSLRDQYLKEVLESTADQFGDISKRMAKDLVETSQWNYRRGASPGVYKYALGRLLGQYGTWPMNYIEYVRRVATQSDPVARRQAIMRLGLAHGSILAGMQSAGIDAGNWVFTQPMAYGGSPIFSAVVSIPNSFDFETYKGAEARREVIKPILPLAIPGGLWMEQVYKAITSDDADEFSSAMGLLGFKTMKKGEENRGLHTLVPE